jgi:hypothetical protein
MLLPKKANQSQAVQTSAPAVEESYDLPQKENIQMVSESSVVSSAPQRNYVARQNVPHAQQIDSSNFDAGETLVKNTNESWINNRWRPAMGWMYMSVCIFDFVLFPILWAVVQFWEVMPENDAFRQWQPLTLQGAGLFHMAMGAVLGISAYGRTKEKVESKN